jgi:hypothetical protein
MSVEVARIGRYCFPGGAGVLTPRAVALTSRSLWVGREVRDTSGRVGDDDIGVGGREGSDYYRPVRPFKDAGTAGDFDDGVIQREVNLDVVHEEE